MTSAVSIRYLLVLAFPVLFVFAQDKQDSFLLEVKGLVWEECRHSVEEALKQIPGVISVEVDLLEGEVAVRSQLGKVKPQQLVAVVNRTTDSAHFFTARLTKKRLRPIPDLDKDVETGPAVGSPIPSFEAYDQHGERQTFQTLRGPKGLILLFYRSADWWPFCKTQLVELEREKDEFRRQGFGVAAISYDGIDLLRHFAQRMSISYPLLSDSKSEIIRAFGILNKNFPTDHKWYGVPFPGTYVIDEHGVVISKYFEEDHRERYTAANIMVQEFAGKGGKTQVVKTAHLELASSASDSSVRSGNRVVLILDINLKPRMHVYAPGVSSSYISVEWEMADSEGWLVHPVSYPAPETLHLPVIQETLPVYSGTFRITRELTIGPQRSVQPLLTQDGKFAVEAKFRYQACDDEVCYPPLVIPLKWVFQMESHDSQRAPTEFRRTKGRQWVAP